jgi:hypothetical protein
VSFGRTEIALNPALGALLERYLAGRRALAPVEEDWQNAYLFPGRLAGSHLSEAAVTYYLGKRGVSAEMLFSSALYYAYLAGMRQPKVLVRAFGITDTTAVRYLNLIDPRLVDEATEKTRAAHGG